MKETTIYKAFNDGWFDFFYCKKCGYKTKDLPGDKNESGEPICPHCKRIIKEVER